jgi:hypothetical protein
MYALFNAKKFHSDFCKMECKTDHFFENRLPKSESTTFDVVLSDVTHDNVLASSFLHYNPFKLNFSEFSNSELVTYPNTHAHYRQLKTEKWLKLEKNILVFC